MAHDENNISKAGDMVRICQTRPLSKNKKWFISEIIKEALPGQSPPLQKEIKIKIEIEKEKERENEEQGLKNDSTSVNANSGR